MTRGDEADGDGGVRRRAAGVGWRGRKVKEREMKKRAGRRDRGGRDQGGEESSRASSCLVVSG